MCLKNSGKDVENFLRKNKNKKYVWFYKCVCNIGDKIITPVTKTEVKSGIFESDSKRTKPYLRNIPVYKGIHVSSDFESKYKRVVISNGGYIISYRCRSIKVKCYLKDLIAYNAELGEAVFSKIYVSNKELSGIEVEQNYKIRY